VRGDEPARVCGGMLHHDDGTACPARFYFGEDEAAPLDRERIDPRTCAMWVEDDGAIGIRRSASSVSVGATPAYAAKYDDVDWGN
jgi:hypothetical protein